MMGFLGQEQNPRRAGPDCLDAACFSEFFNVAASRPAKSPRVCPWIKKGLWLGVKALMIKMA
jgi:hypothetical protein